MAEGKAFLQGDQEQLISLESEVLAFVKQINGHLSLREIFLFLNNKGEQFSIMKCLETLRELANGGFLQNSEDYFDLTSPLKSNKRRHKHAAKVEESYFSEERLIGLIQKTTLFLKCDRETAKNILKESSFGKIEEGTQLIKKGSKSSHFYVLLTGEAGVFVDGECLAYLGPLSVFGESAAVFGQERNADVIINETSWVLRVDASKIVDTSAPETFDAFKGLRSRLILNHTLSANPLFRNLPTDTMQFFITKCRIEKWGKEQTIIEQDGTSGDFYFILSGSVAVIKDGMPVTSLAEGDHFGEIAAIFNEPRTASIISETSCTFLVLNQKALFEVLCSHFRLAMDIEKTALMRRSSSTNLMQIFEEDYKPSQEPTVEDVTESGFQIDQEFLEISQTNFDLEIVDFSQPDNKVS